MKPELPVERIPVALIDTQPQMRTRFEGIDELAESLKRDGLQQPIAVTKQPSGRYLLVFGERRLLAARMNTWSHIDATVRDGLERVQVLTLQWTENEERQNLTPAERSLAIFRVIDELGRQQAKQVLGNKSAPWISKYAAIGGYPQRTRELLDKGLCGDVEVLTVLAEMEREVTKRMEAKAPLEKWTLQPYEDAFRDAGNGALGRKEVRDRWGRLQQGFKWAAQNAKLDEQQAKANARAEADRKRLLDAEKNAKSDPKARAVIDKVKAARKKEREAKALANREQHHAYRMSQARQTGDHGAYVIRRLLEAAAPKEPEQRVLFLHYQSVRLVIGPALIALDLKARKAFLRAITTEFTKTEKPRLSDTTKPPKGWIAP